MLNNMICQDKLREYASKMSDAELYEAVSHLDNITFDEDDVICLMHEYVVSDDDEYGLIFYLPSITKALCNEAVERMRIYSPHIEKQ